MTPKQKTYENISSTIIKNFKKRRIDGFYCSDRKSAVELALSLMPAGSSVAWGGSVTLNETGMLNAVRGGDYIIIDRDKKKSAEEQRKLFGNVCCSDFFLMSTNAVTMDGELINIDGAGSRVAFLCFGPQNVIILAGMNKIVPCIEDGIRRARNVAAPANTVRLNKDTPCSLTGKCENCFSPDCICSQLVITRRSHLPGRIKVILIGEELGY